MTARSRDDGLRRRALDILGAEGEETAREALENGVLELEPSVSQWEGSSGTTHGHRIVIIMEPDVLGLVAASPMAQDALSWSISAALSERPGEALFDLRYETGAVTAPPGGGPYRSQS